MVVRNVTAELRRVTGVEKFPLGGVEIRSLDCEELRLRQVGISEMSFENAKLGRSNLTYVDLAGTTFRNADLRASHIYAVQWCSEAAGRCADLRDTDLRSVHFEHVDELPLLEGARLDGAMISWVTGEMLRRKDPRRNFEGAICLSPREAEACFDYHRSSLLGEADVGSPPTPNCLADLKGPIIRVLGHEPDRLQCERWLAGH